MKARKPRYPSLGTVSHGTMREEDLIPDFASELRYYMKRMRLTREQRKRFNRLLRDADRLDFDDSDLNEPGDVMTELFDALDEIAAPYCYFGATEGDGSDYGFWPIVDNDELPKLTAGYPIPREYWGEDVYLVNDHGNVNCGHVDKRGKFHEYWSCV